MNVYSNLAHRRRTKKDAVARRRAEYLASLPKHPLKRLLYRLHPKRVLAYWFSKRGLFMGLKLVGVAVLLVVLGVGALFAYYRKDLDQIRPSELAKRVQTTVTKYYDRNNKLLWEDKGDGDYTLVVKSEDIADIMKKATIAVEDKDFYKHRGVSISGIMRAGLGNVQGGDTQGGSTLTQQLVKQVFFSQDEAQKRGLDGIPRKIKEMILAVEVERMYDKEQILTLYLNESPYGGRRNGVESAAETYFGTTAKKLTLAQASLLAAIPNQPGLYDPNNKAGNSALVARQHEVLRRMVAQEYITQAQADAAKKENILDTVRPASAQDGNIKAPHFVYMVRSELEAKLGKATVGRGGLIVKTTLDLNIQNKLESEMASMFKSSLPEIAGFTNGAGVIEDVRTSQIIALQGSRDYKYPGFGQDNAATGFIQPGSSIKPLVYAQLFQNQGAGKVNYGSGSILSDSRVTFPEYNNYTPQNADGGFRGGINIRSSLALSRNIPAIKAMVVSGIPQTLSTIRSMGDTYYCTQGNEKTPGPASAIGGCGTRMVDHTNALASLARMGVYKPHTSVLKVTNSSGDTLMQYKDESKKIIDPQAAYVVNDILGDRNARIPLYGRSITPNLDSSGIRVAVKTGTSNTEVNGVVAPKDIWTMIYSPSLSVGIWFGNSTPKPLQPNALSAYSALVADPIMKYASERYYSTGKAKSGEWFARPSGIQVIGGQVYPSYYNRRTGTTNAKMTFDRVSKKRATNCTPSGARIEIAITRSKDPFTQQTVSVAPDGYDATREDDVHKCSDVEPSINSIVVENGMIKVNVSKGTFGLDKLSVQVNGRTVSTKNISSSDTYSFLYEFDGKATVSANVVDTGYYTSSNSTTYQPPSSNNNGGGGRNNGGGGLLGN